MRQYLATLHQRSDRHKKNFALAVAGGATLLMFSIWFAVNFSQPTTVAQNNLPSVHTLVAQGQVQDISPFAAVTANVAASWEALKASFGNLLNVNTTTYGR